MVLLEMEGERCSWLWGTGAADGDASLAVGGGSRCADLCRQAPSTTPPAPHSTRGGSPHGSQALVQSRSEERPRGGEERQPGSALRREPGGLGGWIRPRGNNWKARPQ